MAAGGAFEILAVPGVTKGQRLGRRWSSPAACTFWAASALQPIDYRTCSGKSTEKVRRGVNDCAFIASGGEREKLTQFPTSRCVEGCRTRSNACAATSAFELGCTITVILVPETRNRPPTASRSPALHPPLSDRALEPLPGNRRECVGPARSARLVCGTCQRHLEYPRTASHSLSDTWIPLDGFSCRLNI